MLGVRHSQPSRPRHGGRRGEDPPLLRPGRPPQPAGPSMDDLQLPPKAKKVDTPPRRPNQKRGSSSQVQWSQPRINSKWSRVVAR